MRIAVIGGTGTGKTSFVNTASGSNFRVGGTGLSPITNDLQMSPIVDLSGQRVILIDTPGLDIKRGDKTFKLLEEGLRETTKRRLAGVIFLHKIGSPMDGQQPEIFDRFAKLCVAARLPNIALATTGWNYVSRERGLAEEHKALNHDKFFDLVIRKGAVYTGHYENSLASAQQTLGRVVEGARTLGLDDWEILLWPDSKWFPCLS
ncbi:hypothetical protein JAAARDRAFT_30993 [Jaapia argillacea MUCL 33604]|uniref:G domain-containing protein n=1 Tax=Jaapia argillacea MUCL 33604 TaxID=933084 RepID=A0A067QDH4_9AGAM|nr:hypothetical protein JAAARDRAFT_30993 [Jaapia argillacea MUCL 33604]